MPLAERVPDVSVVIVDSVHWSAKFSPPKLRPDASARKRALRELRSLSLSKPPGTPGLRSRRLRTILEEEEPEADAPCGLQERIVQKGSCQNPKGRSGVCCTTHT